jgi:hypothetical protein
MKKRRAAEAVLVLTEGSAEGGTEVAQRKRGEKGVSVVTSDIV